VAISFRYNGQSKGACLETLSEYKKGGTIMKKLLLMTILILSTVLLIGNVFAEEQSTTTEPAVQAEVKVLTETGTLKSFDPGTGGLVIETANGEVALKITNETNIEVSGVLSDLDSLELKDGAKIYVEYVEETKVVKALSVEQ
jgi:chorismate synthase